MKRKPKDVPNIVVISDQHINCRLGLFTLDRFHLDDGGWYEPSILQRTVAGWWDWFWKHWVPEVTQGEPFAVVNNGDAIDGGAHHGNVTHISANITDQERMAVAMLKPVVDLCEGRYYHLRGTEVHSGKSGMDEEALAERLGAVQDQDGRHARWELWLTMGGRLINFMHHIGTTGSMHYEATALQKELSEAYVEAARWGDRPPDVLVRSHRHRKSEVEIETANGPATCFTTPGWQLKTPFSFRIPGARQSRPQFGGSLIRIHKGEIFTRHFVKSIERSHVEDVNTQNGFHHHG